MASVFDLIAGTYVTIYNRAADPQGANFWATTLGFADINAAAGAPGSLALADQLAPNFYAASSAVFDALYSPTTMLDSQFINAVYVNLGGLPADPEGATFWGNRLTALEATNPNHQVARAIVASEIAFTLQTFDPNATGDAKVRADTYKNKLAVSEAVALTGNTHFNPASQSPTDPAYAGETNVLIGVTDTDASRSVALGQVQAANAANNPALMVGQNPPLTLTTGIDSPTEGFASGHGATATVAGAVFKANPTGGVLGLNNTLNTGDNLQATGDAAGHSTLEFTAVLATAGLLANPGFATGVTMNGIDTLNASNQSNLLGIGALPSGFQGNITGLLTVNDNNSIAGLQLGNTGQGLNTALKNVNINHFAGNPLVFGLGALPVFSADIAQAASSASNALTVTLNGNLGQTNLVPGTKGGAAIISISSDGPQGTAAAPNLSYGTQTYDTTTNTKTYLQLEAQPGGFLGAIVGPLLDPSVDGTTHFVFKGAGTLAVGQDVAGDHQLVQDIDASGTTGSVYITGASSGYGPSAGGAGALRSAFESTPNPGALYGSAAGFLDDTGTGGKFALTTFELGGGTTFLDASSASVAQIKALTTTPGALVALDNEIVVKDAVATTTSLDTFANIKGFSILGIGGSAATDGAGGTVNMANLAAAGFNTIDYVNPAKADVFINNQTAALTVNTYDNGNGHNLTVGTKGPASGLSDTFTLKLGDALHNDGTGTFGVTDGAGSVGNVTLIGDENVNIVATGQTGLGPVITDTIGFVKLTPTLFGHEQVNISGDTNLTIGNGVDGAIASVDGAGALLQNNLGINITNTGVTTFIDAFFGGVLGFIPTGNSNGLAYDFTTNAEVIDASTSGGLIMHSGDANYSTSSSLGDLITGSNSAANALAGSLGNDTITAIFGGDTIATNGGGDKINIAGHSGSDVIDFYGVTSVPVVVPGGNYSAVQTLTNGSITASNGFAQVGWWGIATSGAAAQVADNFATSADLSTVTGFAGGGGGDNLAFSALAWGQNGTNAGVFNNLGLVSGNLARETAGGSGGTLDIQTGVVGGTNINAGTDVIALGNSFTDLNGVLNFFENVGVNLASGLNVQNRADILVAWEDTNHNTHISDLRLHNSSFFFSHSNTADAAMNSSISDMVQLTGTSITDISNANLHLV